MTGCSDELRTFMVLIMLLITCAIISFVMIVVSHISDNKKQKKSGVRNLKSQDWVLYTDNEFNEVKLYRIMETTGDGIFMRCCNKSTEHEGEIIYVEFKDMRIFKKVGDEFGHEVMGIKQ